MANCSLDGRRISAMPFVIFSCEYGRPSCFLTCSVLVRERVLDPGCAKAHCAEWFCDGLADDMLGFGVEVLW